MSWTVDKVKERLNCLNNTRYFYSKTSDSPLKQYYSFLPILKEAAVLIPIYCHNDQLEVLLTIRSKNVRTYSGQVAFPGGIREESDENPIETALRESEEEIGLKKNFVKVIGCLNPVVSRTKVLIFPIVGFIENFPDFRIKLNSDEADYHFSLPLERFLKSDNHLTFPCEAAPNVVICVHNFRDKLSVNNVLGQLVEKNVETFGLTAALCIFCSMIIHRRFVQFDIVDDEEQENFLRFKKDQIDRGGDGEFTIIDDKIWSKLYDRYFNGYLEKMKTMTNLESSSNL
uniref:Nudix hydrolase domain-containing protein n=1 Tax=Romanomermis culicivorax TaxID=13658 RepID=A0A915JCN4_ROMCU